MSKDRARILVIKLGALGDFVQALGPMAAIRHHHAHAHVVLLTSKAYVDFANASNLFDEVWCDEDQPKAWQVRKVLHLRRRLRKGGFSRVYDLQTSDRSNFYFHLLGRGKRPEWSGIAKGCSHPHANIKRNRMHTQDRQRDQLRMAEILHTPAPDVSWVSKDVTHFGIEPPFVLLVPGGAPHRPAKRWSRERYTALANHLMAQGITPVVLGTRAEQDVLRLITREAPGSVNLCAKTDFLDIAFLAQGAAAAVGNDTGPMHLIAAAGCPCIALFSAESDPALCGQRGKCVKILRSQNLESLGEAEVWAALDAIRHNDKALDKT